MADTRPAQLPAAAEQDAVHPARQVDGSGRRRWPLLLIGASAGTATWSGWVGLGELTGFGVVHPLPGIWDDLTLNTAITLPIGVEAYAVYALAVATDPRRLTLLARRWAWASAAGALLLGMGGQIAYHLLAARDVTSAPAWVVALVSSLPVLVLGAASLLWHLAAVTPTREGEHTPSAAAHGVSVSATVTALRPRRVEGETATAALPAGEAAAGSSSSPAALVAPNRADSPGRTAEVDVPDTPHGAAGRPAAAEAAGPGRPRVTARLESPSDAAIVAEILAAVACGPDDEPPSIRALMRTYAIGQKRATRIHQQARENREAKTTEPNDETREPRNHDTKNPETTEENDTSKITNESPQSKIN